MTKKELIDLLKELDIPINEGIQNDKDKYTFPRIVFWEYVWSPIVASDTEYNTTVTYQISFFSNKPRDEKLIKLKNLLNKKHLYPTIEHEYVKENKMFHSFFPVEVIEKIE